jgi:hypothetical protein
MVDLDPVATDYSTAYSVNSKGKAAGWILSTSGLRAALFYQGKVQELGVLNVMEHVRKPWVKELASPVSWPFHEYRIDCWPAYPEGMRRRPLSYYVALRIAGLCSHDYSGILKS